MRETFRSFLQEIEDPVYAGCSGKELLEIELPGASPGVLFPHTPK
jgi:hypothetical protein